MYFRNVSFDEKYKYPISIGVIEVISRIREERGREKWRRRKEKGSGDVWSRKFDRALNLISVLGRRLN